MPFYVAPEQMMKDRADYARKGIARGRAMVALQYADGILLVAEVGVEPADDQLFHILYDGTLIDEQGTSVLGGDAEAIAERLAASWSASHDLSAALPVAVAALAGPDRGLSADDIEVAVLSRRNGRRCFARLDDSEVSAILDAA